MNDDDDLPVLTQVLRTGSGHREASIPPPLESADDPPGPALDVRPIETWMADQLVIGNEPHRQGDGYLTQSFYEGAATVAADVHDAGDVSVAHGTDAFGLSQDHDVEQTGDGRGSFGEPHLHDAVAAIPADRQPTPVDDPAALARRVRDAVLDDLRTRIDTELDARIAQAMRAEVETALAQLQVNLRTHLTDALRDVVQRAVDEEVARIIAPLPRNDASPVA